MKIATIIGARPQFIKAAIVSRHIRLTRGIDELLVHTGQHYDDQMSRVFFEELELPPPAYHLEIGSGPHGAQTGRMLEAIEHVLLQEKPDWVMVYGDTNSTLAGALAAVKLHIPVAHVEAGLRSFNRKMPEEINRILTDHASDLLFAPTEVAVSNLRHEGVPMEKVHLVGDVMYDASLYYGEKVERVGGLVDELRLPKGGYVLATIHRAENTNDRMRLQVIAQGLVETALTMPVVLPLHPRTAKALDEVGLLDVVKKRIQVVEPVGYFDMLQLERHAAVIATDSGGVQKEAYFHGVPCVTLRDETEWVELVETGWNRIVSPTDANSVCRAILEAVGMRGEPVVLYGGGRAAAQIVAVLKNS